MSNISKRFLALLMALVMVLSNVSGIAQTAYAAEVAETEPVVIEAEAPAVAETEAPVVETTVAPVVETTEEIVVETTEEVVIETTEAIETEAAEETVAEETEAAEETLPEETLEEIISEEIVDEEAVMAGTLTTSVEGLGAEWTDATVSGVATWTADGTTINGKLENPARKNASTSTLILTNNLEEEAILTFDWEVVTVASAAEASINGTIIATGQETKGTPKSGKAEFTLFPGSTVTIAVKAARVTAAGGDTATIKLMNLNLFVDAVIKTTFQPVDAAQGSYTVNGTEITEDTSIEQKAAVPYKLVATPADGYVFSGWYSKTNETFISTEAEASVLMDVPQTIYPLFLKVEDAVWSVGDACFMELADAINCAETSNDKVVVLLKDYTLTGDVTVPKGITMLIPFNDEHTCYTDTPAVSPLSDPDGDSHANGPKAWEAPYAYRTLTLARGVTLTIKGAVSVSAQHSPGNGSGQQYAGAPDGPCGFIQLDSGSNINVESDANLYAWGYIVGSGSVEAKSGATVHENLQITDFRGGTASSQMVAREDDPEAYKKIVFPFSQYYVQNIEVPLTLRYGASERVFTSIWAAEAANSTGMDFIGTDISMFQIGEGSYITKSYDGANDRLVVTVGGSGEVIVNALTVALTFGGQNFEISSDMFNLPITSNITINVAGGTATMNQNVALLAGTQVNVSQGTTLLIGDGFNVYVYDGTEWTAENFVHNNVKVRPIAWSFANGTTAVRGNSSLVDAKVDVNGTLSVEGYLYTTKSGANITSSAGAGKIVLWYGNGDVAETYQVIQNPDIKFIEIPLTAPQLKNADGSYTSTADVDPDYGAAYIYDAATGTWLSQSTVTFDANGAEGYMAAEVVENIDIEWEGYIEVEVPECTFTKAGAEFVEWNTQADGKGVSYVPGEVYEVTGNVTLYAIWDIPTYTVTWDVDGVKTEEVYELGATPSFKGSTDKAADGCTTYTFDGWNNEIVPVTGDVTYIATYTEVTKHSGGTATCVAAAVCIKCHQPYGEENPNNHATPNEVTYTNNGETHSATYDCCKAPYVTNEPHTYVDGVCACEAVQTFTVTVDTSAVFGGYELTLTNTTAVYGQDYVTNIQANAGTGVVVAIVLVNDEPVDYTFEDGILTVAAKDVTGDIIVGAFASVLQTIDVNGGVVSDEFLEALRNQGAVIDGDRITMPTVYGWTGPVGDDLGDFITMTGHTFTGVTDHKGEVYGSGDSYTATEDFTFTYNWKCAPTEENPLTHVEAVAATCLSEGNIEHYMCSCGKIFADAEGTNEITAEDTITRNPNNHATPNEVTYTNNGETHSATYDCCEAPYVTNEAHTYVDGVCVCTKKQTVTVTIDEAFDNVTIDVTTATYGEKLVVKITNTEGTGVYLSWVKVNGEPLDNEGKDFFNKTTKTLTIPGDLVTGDVVIRAHAAYVMTMNFGGGNVDEAFVKAAVDSGMYEFADDNSACFALMGAGEGMLLEGMSAFVTKTGYAHTGWTDGTTTYELNAEVYMPAADTTYTMVWTPNDYEVTMIVDGVETTETLAYGTEIKAPAKPSMEGHTFTGWTDGTKTYQPGDVITTVPVDGISITLTPTWKINTYTVTFLDKDGNQIDAQTVEYGTAAAEPEAPAVKGYTFKGWDIDFDVVTSDLTVKAVYTENTYSIHYYSIDGNEIYGTTDWSYTNWLNYNPHGEYCDATDTFEYYVPHHLATGFALEPNGETVYAAEGDGFIYIPLDDIFSKAVYDEAYDCHVLNVYVKFAPKTYTVTWTVNGETYTTTDVAYGALITEPDYEIPEGYTFSGWEIKGPMPGNDITLDATLTLNRYNFTLDFNGGKYAGAEGAEYTATEIEVNYGASVSEYYVKQYQSRVKREGYTLVGWNTQADGKGETVTFPYIMPAKDVTAYAVWEINTYTVTVSNPFGLAEKITLSNTTATHGQDFVATVSTSIGSGLGVLGFSLDGGESWIYDGLNLNHETNELTIEGEFVTGDIAVQIVPYVAVQVDLNGGALTEEWQDIIEVENGVFTTYWAAGHESYIIAVDDEEMGGVVEGANEVVVREHHTLTGYTDAKGNEYNIGEKYSFTEDALLTVNWKANTYTLTVMGYGPEVEPIDLEVAYGARLADVLEENGIDTSNIVVDGGVLEFVKWITLVDFEADAPEFMPAQNIRIHPAYTFTGWSDDETGTQYLVKDEVQMTGWTEIDGAWYYLDPETGYRAEGISRVPYPTEAINGITYAPNPEDLEYDDFVDATESWFVFGNDGKFLSDYSGPANTEKTLISWAVKGMIPWHVGMVKLADNVYAYFIGDEVNGGNVMATGDVYISRVADNVGREFVIGGVYTFGEDGILLTNYDGIVDMADGSKRYYEDAQLMIGAGLVRHVTEDGTVEYYYFCDGESCVNGCGEASYTAFRNTATSEAEAAAAIHWVSKHNDLLPEWDYAFDEHGVILHHEDTSLNGLVDEGEDTIYYIDGVPAYMGLIEIDGNYYYVRSSGKLIKNTSYWISKTNGLLEEDSYRFDENGMIIFTLEQEKFTGILDGYYYVDGVLNYAGLIQIDGDYYYVRSNGQLVKNQKYWVTKTNGLLDEDSYSFDADGKIIFTIEQEKVTGIVDGYYYYEGVKTYAGLIEIDGDIYYINSNCQVITGRTYWITKTNGMMDEGAYTFDADGKMVQEEPEELINGIVDGYYYVDGVKTYAGLIEIDGKIYYINSSCQVVIGRKYWVTKTNGLADEGAYTFDETGAMVIG